MPTGEREITGPVDLCLADGRLNPEAVGWTRRPLHRCNLRGWGRTKRWEYWCVTTPTHLLSVTVSNIDLIGLNAVYFLDFETGREINQAQVTPFGRGVRLPESLAEDTTVRVGGGKLGIEITTAGGDVRIQATCKAGGGESLAADVTVALPAGHETLGVVVPWSDRRFQYTSKHTARPARGEVRIGDRTYAFGADAWGVLDHGRGRWPHDIAWNWGAASGPSDSHVVGLQFGGKWTAGTGMTENALCVDGRLTKLGEELDWQYDIGDFMKPWTIRTPSSDHVELTFEPFHEKREKINLGVFGNETHQCFGRYTGRIRTEDDVDVEVRDLLGWAEQVHMRW